MLGSKRGAACRPHIALSAISGGALLWSAAAAAQTASQPEAVLITARPPDPVGNAAFSTVVRIGIGVPADGGSIQIESD